jgi:hypothetical protein
MSAPTSPGIHAGRIDLVVARASVPAADRPSATVTYQPHQGRRECARRARRLAAAEAARAKAGE